VRRITAVSRSDIRLIITGAVAIAVAAGSHLLHGPTALQFVSAGVSLAVLAMLIGHSTEHLGHYMSAGATGVLQSAVANLPELFVCIFALRAGLVDVVRAALVGSILANILLVFGLAIVVGGLKNGRQKFHSESARLTSTMLLLAVAAMVVPTLVHHLHTPADLHANTLSGIAAGLLLIVFICSIPYTLKAGNEPEEVGKVAAVSAEHAHAWTKGQAFGILAGCGVAAAFVSEWFVAALEPTMHALGISEAFAGFVIVAIAGNAVENVVGIQLAAKNKMDYAVSVILTGCVQVALAVVPVLVLASFFLGGPVLTLIISPLLVVGLLITTIIIAVIVADGETIWLEGVALIGLYGIIAISLWWG
jgi:Ca2+:H+ antiporter